ncbi:hypothetical protein [Pectobacterium brasiliense]|nr:hypothetical protein [Pectobacterium brasiliense]
MVKAIALIGVSLDLFIFYSFQFRNGMKSVVPVFLPVARWR